MPIMYPICVTSLIFIFYMDKVRYFILELVISNSLLLDSFASFQQNPSTVSFGGYENSHEYALRRCADPLRHRDLDVRRSL